MKEVIETYRPVMREALREYLEELGVKSVDEIVKKNGMLNLFFLIIIQIFN